MGDVVTFDMAQDALLAAVEYLGAMPDKERAFLSAGSRSAWPAIVRDLQADYADRDARPRLRLTRRQVELVDAMLLSPDAAALAIVEHDRRLVGRVLVAKLVRAPSVGFSWSEVWQAERGQAWSERHGCIVPVTSDALRVRYSRAVRAVAVRMGALGIGL